MEPERRKETAEAWLRYQATFDRTVEDPPDQWAYDALVDLTSTDPETTWLIILDLLAMTSDEEMLGMIGTAPLEDLVCDYGEEFIDRIEETAHENERLRYALSYVWANRAPVRPRLDALMDFLGEPRTR